MSTPRFLRAVLVLPVNDMARARAWYATVLGFQTTYLHDDPVEDPDGNYAVLRRDDAELHLLLDEPPRTHPWSKAGTGYLYLVVEHLDALFDHVRDRHVPLARQLRTESWGARAFQLTDPSGNLILVAEDAPAQ